METHVLLLQIAAILVTARVFAEIAARLNSPRVIGELCAGIVLGPSLLGWITPNEPIKLLAEIGIILLLFEVGLETDLGRLVQAGQRALVLAIVGFVVPFLLGFGICYYTFEQPMLVSLFIGGTLTA
ncbi:MAG: sodium:proton antiporter, partial [Gammaproteobacteria bacterium SG8_11]